MTEKVVLHVGMHKTGSTAIQNALAETGSSHGWEYLNFKHPNASNIVKQAFCGKEVPKNGNPQPSYAENIEQARFLIEQRLAETRARVALISGEELRHLKEPNLKEFISVCRDNIPHFGAVEAVAYVRAPFSFLHASYQQRLQVQFLPLSSLQDPRRIDFSGQFATLELVLGPSCVGYRPFLRDRFPGRSVVQDFADWMQTGPLSEPAKGDNSSLSSEAVRLLFLWRSVHMRMKPGDGKIIRALQELDGPPLHFSEVLLNDLRPALRAQARWAEQRMGWDMVEDPVADQPHSIRGEADFEKLTLATLEWLGQRSDLSVKRLSSGPDAVIEGLAALRDRILNPVQPRSRFQRLVDRAMRR